MNGNLEQGTRNGYWVEQKTRRDFMAKGAVASVVTLAAAGLVAAGLDEHNKLGKAESDVQTAYDIAESEGLDVQGLNLRGVVEKEHEAHNEAEAALTKCSRDLDLDRGIISQECVEFIQQSRVERSLNRVANAIETQQGINGRRMLFGTFGAILGVIDLAVVGMMGQDVVKNIGDRRAIREIGNS